MSAAELSRFDELVSRYLDAALADTDATELVALLAEPPLATRFLETTRLNSEIAGLLANGGSTRGIAEQLELSVRTVEGYRSRIMMKLEITSLAQLVRILEP